MFAEHVGTLGDPMDPTYSDPIVKRWNQTIGQGDAYVFVTPEYNHSFPAVIKNAIDNVWVSFAFRNKPVALVGYSTGMVGGARAVEQLALVAIEAELAPLKSSVLVGRVHKAFDADGEPVHAACTSSLEVMLDDLAWWGGALRDARSRGELPPGGVRLYQASAGGP
jgi:NAD(P)H-dependent FMN reductase